MRKFFIVVCLFSVLGLGFCVEIDGSVKAATATPISQGVYEDARIAKYDYKYYTINVPKP